MDAPTGATPSGKRNSHGTVYKGDTVGLCRDGLTVRPVLVKPRIPKQQALDGKPIRTRDIYSHPSASVLPQANSYSLAKSDISPERPAPPHKKVQDWLNAQDQITPYHVSLAWTRHGQEMEARLKRVSAALGRKVDIPQMPVELTELQGNQTITPRLTLAVARAMVFQIEAGQEAVSERINADIGNLAVWAEELLEFNRLENLRRELDQLVDFYCSEPLSEGTLSDPISEGTDSEFPDSDLPSTDSRSPRSPRSSVSSDSGMSSYSGDHQLDPPLISFSNENEFLMPEADSLHERLQETQEALEQKNSELSNTRAQIQEARNGAQALQGVVVSQQDTLHQLIRERTQLADELSALRSQQERQGTKREDGEGRIRELESRLAEKERESDRATARYTVALDKLQLALRSEQETRGLAWSELQKVQEQAARLRDEKDELFKEIREVESRLSDECAGHAGALSDSQTKDTLIRELRDSRVRVENSEAELKAELTDSREALHKAQTQVEVLRTQLDESKAAIERDRQESQARVQQLHIGQQQQQQSQQQNQLQQQIVQLNIDLGGGRGDQGEARTELETETRELARKNDEYRSLGIRLNVAQRHLSEAADKAQRLEGDKGRLQAEARDLREALADGRGSEDELKEQLRLARKEIQAKEAALTLARETQEGQLKMLVRINDDLSNKAETISTITAKAVRLREKLEEKDVAARKEHTRLSGEVKKLEEDKIGLSQTLENIREGLEKESEARVGLGKEVEKLKEENRELEKSVDEKRRSLFNKMQTSKSREELLTRDLGRRDREIAELKEKMAAMEKRFNEELEKQSSLAEGRVTRLEESQRKAEKDHKAEVFAPEGQVRQQKKIFKGIRGEKKKLEEELRVARISKEPVDEELREVLRALEEAEEAVRATEKDNGLVNKHNKKLAGQVDLLTDQSEKLTEEKRLREAEIVKIKEQLKVSQDKEKELAVLKDESEGVVVKLRSQLESAEQKWQTASEELETFKSSQAELDERISELSRQAKAVSNRAEKLEIAKSKAEEYSRVRWSEMLKTQFELDEARQTVERQKDLHDSDVKKLALIEGNFTGLQMTLKETENKRDGFSKLLEEKKQECLRLKGELDSTWGKLSKEEGLRQSEKEKADEVAGDFESSKSRVTELEEKISQIEGERESLKVPMKAIESKAQEVRRDVEGVRLLHRAMEETIHQKFEQLGEYVEKVRELEKYKKEAEEQLVNKSERNEALGKELKEIRGWYSKFTSKAFVIEIRLNKQLKDLEAQKTELEETLQEARDDLSKKENVLSHQEGEFASVRGKLDVAKKDLEGTYSNSSTAFRFFWSSKI